MDTQRELTKLALLRSFYGADWVDPISRSVAVADLRRAAMPGFEWHVVARVPPVTLRSDGLDVVGEGIEQDFSTYMRRPTDQIDPDLDELRILGWIFGRTRYSRETVRRRFEDLWSFDAGHPLLLVSR